MPNHLSRESSPYLLQHSNNPVDWHPWGSEALEKARREDKPIFLSIGYAACHWCHVMAYESFEDPEAAAFMNEHFVNIKVDREERPDLDSIYMAATQALTGSGGWPMSVFLTPDLRPFYAGTYFPPVRRYNLPSFREVLSSISDLWQQQRDEVGRVGNQVLQHIQPDNLTAAGHLPLTEPALDAITKILLDHYDWSNGGWGGAPKFPQPMLVEYLLRRAVKASPPQEASLRAALHALKAMARGGMYDVVGGGFARYATDDFWRVPHFEKMLYDNAQLSRAYLHAWQITKDSYYRRVVIQTLEFAQREMMAESGGFYSSLDADSEGQEGKFYVWTRHQVRTALPDDTDFELFAAAYGITERGNWEGKTVLQRMLDDASLAARFRTGIDAVQERLDAIHQRLLAERAKRVRPATDDKILASWNGLMLRAFSEAARVIGDDRNARQYLDVARRNADFLLGSLRVDGRLRRSWRQGAHGPDAFLEDYASLILGLLELYQADFEQRWFAAAQELAEDMIAGFADADAGFFDTSTLMGPLLLRPRDLQDNATPSGSALACEALLRLAAFTERGDFRDRAEHMLGAIGDAVRRFPSAFGHWLNAADFALAKTTQIALVYAGGREGAGELLDVVNAEYRPNTVVAGTSYPPLPDAPSLVRDRPLRNGQSTAYVCEHFVCKQPVISPTDLQEQL